MSYPKYRKPAGKITCEICGKLVYKRGYKGHLWLGHGLKAGVNMSKNQANNISNVSSTRIKINEYLDKLAENSLDSGYKDLRAESLRNFKTVIGTPDEYSTGRYIFRRKNDRWYSIEECER
jgi:hypothetical protein